MKFVVSGEMDLGAETRKFEKTVDAESEKLARERIYSVFGSVHGLKRKRIKIISVEKERAKG